VIQWGAGVRQTCVWVCISPLLAAPSGGAGVAGDLVLGSTLRVGPASDGCCALVVSAVRASGSPDGRLTFDGRLKFVG
jgi:hypothetical protein